MKELMGIVFISTYFCMVFFFLITCANSFRKLKNIKMSSKLSEDFYKKCEQEIGTVANEYLNEIKDLSECVRNLEKKIDELRLHVNVISGRMGDYSRIISISSPHNTSDNLEKKKPGWPAGKPRKIPFSKPQ